MKGYVTQKGTRWYAVIYEGLDPITGREQRRWHAAGTSRADAERLATRLAKQRNGRNDEARALTFGAYLTRRWLPGKKVNRGLVSVGYELHESRGKTANARRRIALDPTTVDVLTAWRDWQHAERRAVGLEPPEWVFTDTAGQVVHPDKLTQTFDRIVARTNLPAVRLHDLRHTQATLLIDAGVPVKVVSERLGHATAAFTIETYQHVLPSMQTRAVDAVAQIMSPPVEASRLTNRKKTA